MNWKTLKFEQYMARQALRQGIIGDFLKYRYTVAPRILKINKVLEKPINNNDFSIHLLTCHRDLTILLWSLASFYRVINTVGQLYAHSDGSLTDVDIKKIKLFFPKAIIIKPEHLHKNYIEKFNDYPNIKKYRFEKIEKFKLLFKLLDPFFISPCKKVLIIDSDLIWLKRPTEIENEINNNKNESLMMYCKKGGCPVYFKFNKAINNELAKYNSGIVLYNKSNFSLDRLEDYFDKLNNDSRNNHFIEQAGYAYCLENLKDLDEHKYMIKGKMDERVVMRHYTGPRRHHFYAEGLKVISQNILK